MESCQHQILFTINNNAFTDLFLKAVLPRVQLALTQSPISLILCETSLQNVIQLRTTINTEIKEERMLKALKPLLALLGNHAIEVQRLLIFSIVSHNCRKKLHSTKKNSIQGPLIAGRFWSEDYGALITRFRFLLFQSIFW